MCRFNTLLIALLLPSLVFGQAWADEADPGHTPEDDQEPTEHPDVPAIVPLMHGEAAPWDGLLVPEPTFVHYLTLDLDLREAQGLLQIKTDLLEEQRTIYNGAIAAAATPAMESWWDRYSFTVGIVLGLVLGVGLVFGGAALLEYI